MRTTKIKCIKGTKTVKDHTIFNKFQLKKWKCNAWNWSTEGEYNNTSSFKKATHVQVTNMFGKSVLLLKNRFKDVTV